MIQGQSLGACFADVVHAELTEEPTEELQISGYVMLSRARYPELLWILRPFSPKLFAQGAPTGPSILLRKLLGEITSEEAVQEMRKAETKKDMTGAEQKTKKKKVELYCCTHCMLSKNENYMKPSHAFGADTAEDILEKILKQGAWTRCLKCQKAVGKPNNKTTDRMCRTTANGKSERLCPQCCTFQPSAYFRKDEECCKACQHLT